MDDDGLHRARHCEEGHGGWSIIMIIMMMMMRVMRMMMMMIMIMILVFDSSKIIIMTMFCINFDLLAKGCHSQV